MLTLYSFGIPGADVAESPAYFLRIARRRLTVLLIVYFPNFDLMAITCGTLSRITDCSELHHRAQTLNVQPEFTFLQPTGLITMSAPTMSSGVFRSDMTKLVQALPEPYLLMREGEEIFPGCMLGNPDLGTWSIIGPQYWGTRYDGGYAPFAAPACPEGFRIAHGDVITAPDALIWRKTEKYWCQMPEIWQNLHLHDYWHTQPSINYMHYRRNSKLLYLMASDAFICVPIEDSWRTKVLPESHRPLYIGDIVRKNDRMINADVPKWTLATTTVFGAQISAETMACTRFARPIPSRWHNWYVDLRDGRGRDKSNDGTKPSQACATVNGVLQKINERQQQTGIPMFGVIWDVRGIPAHVIDVPLDAPLESLGVKAHSNVSGTPHTIHWLLQHLELAGEPLSQTALLQLAHEAMPDKHRELTAAEVCQEHDLIFTLSPGDRLPMMWQPAHARLWHSPGSRHFIFCRHTDAPAKLESPEIRLLNHGERISKIEKILTGIVDQLNKLNENVTTLTDWAKSRDNELQNRK